MNGKRETAVLLRKTEPQGRIWENLCSLYGVHIFNYLAPLAALPYLARVLGPGSWGALAFAEAYASYVTMFVEYGFGLSATREIARARADREKRAQQLAGVLGGQVLLGALCLALTVAAASVVPGLRAYRTLLPFAYLLGVARAAIPVWYFQGLERMRLVGMLNIATALAATGATFAVVHGPQDVWKSMAARAMAAMLAGAAALTIAWRETPARIPRIGLACSALRQGWSLFLFRGAVSFYTTANVLVLGLIAPAAVVAWFAGAEKIVKAAIGALNPITQTFYPRINCLLGADPEGARRTARQSARLTIGAGLAAGLFIFAAAPLLVRVLLGPSYGESVATLRVLAMLPPLIAASVVLGIQWMLPLRLDWVYSQIVAGAAGLNVVLALILAPRFHQMGMAASVVVAEAAVTVGVCAALRKRRLDPWSEVKLKAEAVAA